MFGRQTFLVCTGLEHFAKVLFLTYQKLKALFNFRVTFCASVSKQFFVQLFTSKLVISLFHRHYENEPVEWFHTKPRFETEAKGNSLRNGLLLSPFF